MWITFSIMLGFAAAATVANFTLDYNYMFLRRGDGTPYDIFYNLVGGHPVLYPIIVIGLFIVYILMFYFVFYLACGRRRAKREAMEACEAVTECADGTEASEEAPAAVPCAAPAEGGEACGIRKWLVEKTPLRAEQVQKLEKLVLPVGIAGLTLLIASCLKRSASEEARNRRFEERFR